MDMKVNDVDFMEKLGLYSNETFIPEEIDLKSKIFNENLKVKKVNMKNFKLHMKNILRRRKAKKKLMMLQREEPLFNELRSVLNWKTRNYTTKDIENLYLTNVDKLNHMQLENKNKLILEEEELFQAQEYDLRGSKVYQTQE